MVIKNQTGKAGAQGMLQISSRSRAVSEWDGWGTAAESSSGPGGGLRGAFVSWGEAGAAKECQVWGSLSSAGGEWGAVPVDPPRGGAVLLLWLMLCGGATSPGCLLARLLCCSKNACLGELLSEKSLTLLQTASLVDVIFPLATLRGGWGGEWGALEMLTLRYSLSPRPVQVNQGFIYLWMPIRNFPICFHGWLLVHFTLYLSILICICHVYDSLPQFLVAVILSYGCLEWII